MNKDDLTQVKNIGSARMKLLNSQGITTIQQLYEIPLEKLEQVKGIGKHYAKLIKNAVTDFYGEKEAAPVEPVPEVTPGKVEKPGKIDQKLNKELAKTTKYLKATKEKLKPVEKKKHVKLFLEFKKRSNKLKTQISALSQIEADLSAKQRKRMIKKAAALNTKLKNAGKKNKSKTMNAFIKEIQSFSKLIK